MAVIFQTNKKTGITYAYQNEPYWDNLDSQKIITWSGAQHLRCYIIATASS